jgi:putative transposase
MPNHVHGIVWLPGGHAPPLPVVIGSFKSAVSRLEGGPLWQRSFYDRMIRSDIELRALRQYVTDNPLRWALDRENPACRR